MRKYILTAATAGLLAITSVSGVFAQPVPTPAAAQAAAISACTTGTSAACAAALTVLTAAIRAANPTAPAAVVSAAVLTSFQTVVASVEAAGGPVTNIATVDAVFAAEVPEVTEAPSASPA